MARRGVPIQGKMRADVYIHTKGYADSRKRAQTLISLGAVSVDGKIVKRSSESIDDGVSHSVEVSFKEKYVGRGGLKLEKALELFGVSVAGLRCIDIGASTGGFTDCLLQHGAASVCAVDSGRGQLHPSLAGDARVSSYEGMNARDLSLEDVGGVPFDIAVMDVSFISQTYIIPPISNGILRVGGVLISLIKPQFEAGRAALDKHGIVKAPSDRYAAAVRVVEAAYANGFELTDMTDSPIKGGDGNTEYLAAFAYTGSKAESISPDILAKIKRTVLPQRKV